MRRIADHRIDVAALLAYVVLSLVVSRPLPTRMTTHVAGRYMDARVFQWNNWWVKRALLSGHNLYYTDSIYYPAGTSLSGHNFNWVSSFLSVPLDLLFGPALAYNLTFLFTLWLSAFGMYLLVRYLVQRRDAAFAAGLVFGFYPYHISGNWAGQMNLGNTQWLPLFALFWLRTMDRREVGSALLAGIFYALASLDCWFFMVFLGIWGAMFWMHRLIVRRRWDWCMVSLPALALTVSAALIAPFLLPVLGGSGTGTVNAALNYYEDEKSTDLLSFVVPDPDHPLLGRAAAKIYERFSHKRPAFLGYTTLALAAYAIVRSWRKSAPWFLSGLLFTALALGTSLRIQGVEYPSIPTPFRVLTDLLPAFKLVRQANRFNVMVGLSLAVLVGIAGADLLRRLGGRPSPSRSAWPSHTIAGLLSALILFEYLPGPCPLLPQQVSPFYDRLAREKGDWAVVELPLEFLYARRSLFAQTVHGKALVNGYVARASADTEAFVYTNPVLKAFRLRTAPNPSLHDIPAAMGVLAANDIRYIVIHRSPMFPHPAVEEEVLADWTAFLGPEPLYQDDEILAYSIEPASIPDSTSALHFGDALGLVGIKARRTQILEEQFLAVDLTWTALRALERGYAYSLSLIGSTGEVTRIETAEITPQFPTSRWKEGVVVAESFAIPLDPSLPGGDYELSITVTELSSGDTVDVVRYALAIDGEAEPFVPALADMEVPVDVTFGNQMWLLGYSQRQEQGRLALEMYWQALRAMETNFKIFVHLVRPGDGAIVAQQDVMPRGWSYPTSLWSRQEVFVDRIVLDLKGIEPGGYRLAVGVYRPETGRLPALAVDGGRIQEDRAFLPGTITLEGR